MTIDTNVTNTAVPITFADSPFVDSFGRVRVSLAETVFDSQQVAVFDTQKIWDGVVYDSASPALLPVSVGAFVTGSNGSAIGVTPSGFDVDTRLVTIKLNNTYASSRAIIQSKEYIPYVPSKSQLIRLTGIFAPQATKINQQVKLVARTSVSGSASDVTYSADKADWNIDTMDGSGDASNPSGIDIDFSKIQILVMDAQMLYSGRIRYGFEINGILHLVHQFFVANESSLPTMQTFSLPIRYEVSNQSNRAVSRCGYFDSKNGLFLEVSDEFNAGNATIHMKCNAVLTEGGKQLGLFGGKVARYGAIALTTTPIPLLTVRTKLTVNDLENRSRLFPTQISVVNSGNEAVEFFLVHDAGLVGASVWNSTDTTKTYEYNTDATAFSGGDDATGFSGGHIVASSASPSGSGNVDTIGFIGAIKFRTPIVLSKIDDLVISQETLTLGARTTAGTSSCDLAILNLEELYV